MNMVFEIWLYRGLIAVLLIVIWWMVQRWITKQEEYNSRIFQLLDKNEQAINRLNVILDANSELCGFKHDEINRRLNKIEG